MSIIRFQWSNINLRKRGNEEKWKKRYREWGQAENQPIVFDEGTLKQIVQAPEGDENAAELLVKWSDRLGAIFEEKGLSSSQIRNIFGEVRNIEQMGFDDEKNRARFLRLIPKLEYTAAREKKATDLKNVLVKGVHFVEGSKENFQRFVEFFEAILAYHKAYGGR